MNLTADIVEYLTGERRAMKPDDLAMAIRNDALHNAAWPKAPFTAWQAAIRDAIKSGQLIEDGDKVKIAPPFEIPKQKLVQKGLFDD
jgi:hypothetical protein